MRIVLAAFAAATVGLVAAGALGVAVAAETTTTPTTTTTTTTTTVTSTAAANTLNTAPPRTVAVQGVATEPIEITANATAATAVYRQAMAAAISDGQTKAQFLAGKAGAALGLVQSIAEGGGGIYCPGNLEYEGEQPDFGNGITPGNVVAGASAPALRRPAAKPSKPIKHAKHKHRARRATLATCTLSTQVALVYGLS
jgi:hypothetical protein